MCHGSYHTPEPYQPFIEALGAQGITAQCPQLPASDLTKLNVGDPQHPDYDSPPPQQGYPQPTEDAVVLERNLKVLIDQGKYVVVLGHSSGGFVAAYITKPDLQAKVRKSEGKTGGIIGIFFECAFLIPPNESIHTFFQPRDGSTPVIPPWTVVYVSSVLISSRACTDEPQATWLHWTLVDQGRGILLLQRTGRCCRSEIRENHDCVSSLYDSAQE